MRFVQLIALSVLAACAGAGPPPPSAPSPLLAGPVPAFRRPALDGGTIETEALRGRPVVLEFFARYCRPCRETLPAANRLAARHPDVAFVGVAEDDDESESRALVGELGLRFPVVHDRAHVLSGRFRITELPATFLVDASGTVRWVGGAGQPADGLARALASLR